MFDTATGYEKLKEVIKTRHADRLVECRDQEVEMRILRAQGAARELSQLLDIIAEMEHEPVENGKENG